MLGDRSLFPDLEWPVYLNHAALAPLPSPACEAMAVIVRESASRAAAAYAGWAKLRSKVRAQLAQLVGAAADEIALMPNTTSGITAISTCFPWRRGDRIVVFRGEFPANVVPWQQAARLHGLRLVWQSADDFRVDDAYALARLEKALAQGVRLVAVSAVQFQTGLKMPLEEIGRLCRRFDAQLFVDAIQACGAVPLDVQRCGIDYLACGGHKWLMAVGGAGFLYVARARAHALRTHLAGWLSGTDDLRYMFEGPGLLRYDWKRRRDAGLFESGNQNTLGCAALSASLDVILRIGVENVYRHVQEYLDGLESLLVAGGFQSLRAPDARRRSCILSAVPPAGQDARRIQAALAHEGICCATPEGHLRFSPHWPNDRRELDHVDGALRRLGKGTRS